MPPSPALQAILPLLHARNFTAALPKLEALVHRGSKDPDVFYNLGLALSETQQFPEAVIALKRVVELDPNYQRAWVGIGVAYSRLRKYPDGRVALETALRLKPGDGLAMMNLTAALGSLGENEEAAEMARKAVAALPPNPQALWGLATAVKEWAFDPGAETKREWLLSEASDAYKLFLERYPNDVMAEEAKKELTLIAETALRANVVGGFRPDVFEYIIYALKLFDEIGVGVRNRLVFEIAELGSKGLNINSREQRYELSTLRGLRPNRTYSALQLVAFMYAGMQQVDPTVNAGADFSREYEAALVMSGRTKDGT